MSNDTCQHHYQYEYCRTRLKYRNGRQLRAVTVYTIANESQHLLVFGVPKINLQQELKHSIQRFGAIEFMKCVTNEIHKQVELEQFTDVYHVKFNKIEHSRRAKRILDAREFYGGLLHISYAPEYETLDELKNKLEKRQKEISYRLRLNSSKNE